MMYNHDRNLDYYPNDSDMNDSWGNDFVSVITSTTLTDPQYGGERVLMRDIDPLLFSPQQDEKTIKQESDLPNCDAWKSKMIDEWTSQDVLAWLGSEARFFGVMIHDIGLHKFAGNDGNQLKKMNEEDFLKMSSSFGSELYHHFQSLSYMTMKANMDKLYQIDPLTPPLPCIDDYYIHKYEHSNYNEPAYSMTNLDDDSRSSLYGNHTPNNEFTSEGSDSGFDSGLSTTRPVIKRKPGRPRGSRRKKKPEKLGRLWEFIRDLLLNAEYCPSLICWDNYEEGMFRFVHSDKVAKLWGSKKDNPDMNYEKLSRAMRYYYKSKVLQPVLGRRLVYKFGPTATGWRTPNPNFRGRG